MIDLFIATISRAVIAILMVAELRDPPHHHPSLPAFHARVRGSVPGSGGLKETKNVSSPSTCESQYCGEPP